MRLSRVHTVHPLAADSQLTLEEEAAHYLGRVLRLRPGDQVALFNGDDGEFLATIAAVNKRSVSLDLGERLPNQADPALPLHLGVGLSRGDRMDLVIQKSTELGAGSITPLFSERCEVRLDARRSEKKLQHWRRIAIAASEQSGRCSVPQVNAPVSLDEWLASAHEGTCLVLDHRAGNALSLPGPGEVTAVTLLSGPEGGFNDDELDRAAAGGFSPVSMGPRVLRTETAPLVALSIIQHLSGDFSR